MQHNNANEEMIRYVYILEIDNRGLKSRFYGHKKMYYVGQTNDLKRRIQEHLNGSNSAFLKRNFPDSRKIPIYIKTIKGTEYDLIEEEYKIKKMSTLQKRKLIQSEDNELKTYIPCKALILKKTDGEELIRL